MSFTLRVSVLEHCQLRCLYCLPPGSSTFLTKKSWLTLDQYESVAHALSHFPINKIRFTGGEPTLREELVGIVAIFSRALPLAKIAVTTNGLRFSSLSTRLVDAGVRGVTFHLDTLKPERYQHIMGRGDVDTVHHAIAVALRAGMTVKLNMVVQKSINHDEIVNFLQWSQESGVSVRFIELMNTGSAKDYVAQTFMTGEEILDVIRLHSDVVTLEREHGSDPAERFFASRFNVVFGLIASDTRPFCSQCNRLRLSADGKLRTCLYEPTGFDLTSIIYSPDDLRNAIGEKITKKTSWHPAMRKVREDFSMSQIGG